MERSILKMKFLDANGKTMTMSIPNPKEGLTASEVKTVGDLIVEKQAMSHRDVALAAYKEASMVTTTTEVLA